MTQPDDAQAKARYDDFESEIRRLGVSAGTSQRDRILTLAGLAIVIVGLVVGLLGVNTVRSATTELGQGDGLAEVILGVGLAIVGVVIWARFSMTRYLRYWLVRRIIENRMTTNRPAKQPEPLAGHE